MTDDLEIRLKDLLAERGREDQLKSATLVDAIAGFPARSSRRFHPALAAAIVVMVVGVGAFLATRGGFVGGVPVPPDPAAFAGDPRLDACFAGAGSVEFVFEMRHARDYQRHLPAMGRSPELEVDDPAFALIFASGDLRVGGGGVPGASPEPTEPGHRAVCVLVGDSPNLYTDVDITGFQAIVPDLGPTTAMLEPTPTGTAAAGPTVAPAPAWVADLAGQLECDGPLAELGQEVEVPDAPLEPAGSPVSALQTMFLNYTDLPTTAWDAPEIDGHWARHRYQVGNRLKALAVSTDSFDGVPAGIGWEVVGVRACDPSEFAPPLVVSGLTIWLDADGNRVRTDVLASFTGPGHCGWDSAIFLNLGASQYLRDPDGVLIRESLGRFDADATLPGDAVDTGYHTPKWRLFTIPGGDAVFVQTEAGVVERWPRARDGVGCA